MFLGLMAFALVVLIPKALTFGAVQSTTIRIISSLTLGMPKIAGSYLPITNRYLVHR